MLGEFRLEFWLKHLKQRLLDQSIKYRRDAKCAYPAVWLRYFHLAYRRWNVISRQ